MRRHSDGAVSCVVVCFDDFHNGVTNSNLKDRILDGLRSYPQDYIKAHPFGVYDAFMKVIIWEYDRALWLFRKPIRDIEKVIRPPPFS